MSIDKKIEEFDKLHKNRTVPVSRKEYHAFLKESYNDTRNEALEEGRIKEREMMGEIINNINVFECTEHGKFYSEEGYDNPAWYADRVADCPDCGSKSWHINTDDKLLN